MSSNETPSPSSKKWNSKNPSVRRILADVRELKTQPSKQYAANPNEDNVFEWHFTIRGPKGTDFEGGRYHGRITLPAQWPFKPPSIIFLTPNGRWEVKQKICLSISAYHPEHWQPAWGIRTILEALISFMNSPADGAVGALEYTPELRKQLAKESLSYQHPLMPELPPLEDDNDDEEGDNDVRESMRNKFAEQIAQLHIHKLGNNEDKETSNDILKNTDAAAPTIDPRNTSSANTNTTSASTNNTNTSAESRTTSTPSSVSLNDSSSLSQDSTSTVEEDLIDNCLLVITVSIIFAIIAILYRKALSAYGVTQMS